LGKSSGSGITTVIQRQSFPWGYVYIPPGSRDKIGNLDEKKPLCLATPADVGSLILEGPNAAGGPGILGKAPRFLYLYAPANATADFSCSLNGTNLPRFQKVPFYRNISDSSNPQFAMDDKIVEIIRR
jgi:hypothetical protein